MMERSDAIDTKAYTLAALSDVDELAGRHDDARRTLRDAIQLFELKGNEPVADHTRTQLEQLEGDSPA